MSRWLFGVAPVLAAYFPAATWSVLSYVDPAPKPGAIQLLRPFVWEDGFAWRVGQQPSEDAATFAGDFAIWQDDRPLERNTQFGDLEAMPAASCMTVRASCSQLAATPIRIGIAIGR